MRIGNEQVAVQFVDHKLEMAHGYVPPNSTMPISTLHVSFDFASEGSGVVLEIRATGEQNIPVPPTTVGVSQGAYARFENFEKQALGVAVFAIVAVIIVNYGVVAATVTAGLAKGLELLLGR